MKNDRKLKARWSMEPDDDMERGDEVPYSDWIDDLDFAVLDCEEIELEEGDV